MLFSVCIDSLYFKNGICSLLAPAQRCCIYAAQMQIVFFHPCDRGDRWPIWRRNSSGIFHHLSRNGSGRRVNHSAIAVTNENDKLKKPAVMHTAGKSLPTVGAKKLAS